jgi:hypothetical protein
MSDTPTDPDDVHDPQDRDPMPEDLQRNEESDEVFEEADPMEGDAPTG